MNSLLAQARKDAALIASAGGFQDDINITTPSGSLSVDVTGLCSAHWISFDNDGNSVNASSSHVDIHEQILIDAGYTVRNASGKVALRDHKVKVKDVTGILRTYTVVECHPNGTTGLLVCILGQFTE